LPKRTIAIADGDGAIADGAARRGHGLTDPRESVNPVIDVMSVSSAYRLTNLLVPYISGYTFHVALVHVRTPTLLRSAEDSSSLL
jgi:hypothetical protein